MIQIVRAEEKRIPQIVKLWEEFMDFHKDIDPRFPMRKDAPLIWGKHLATLMNSEDTHVLVALDGGRAVGFSISMLDKYPPVFQRETCGFIAAMAITATCRRKGVGQKMVVEILAWFRSKGVERVELTTTAQNAVASSFWQKQGFKIYMHRLYREIA
jgi:GNAT superfamily N-acetyltransferase